MPSRSVRFRQILLVWIGGGIVLSLISIQHATTKPSPFYFVSPHFRLFDFLCCFRHLVLFDPWLTLLLRPHSAKHLVSSP